MIQLHILSGKKAGTLFIPHHLPMTAGRSSPDLCLVDDGVWDHHFQLTSDPDQGILIRAEKNALLQINGQPVQQAVLHNGDLIAAGATSMRFDLGPVHQASLALREAFTWSGLVLLFLFLLALIFRLAKH